MTSSPARVAPLRALVADSKHGPLPALLVSLTVVTGLVDAVSILSLGRVFVANMTGNVVLVGFAAAGAPGFSLSASLSALGGFLLGAFVAGRVAGRLPRRAALFATGTTAELVLFIAALIVVSAQSDQIGHAVADVVAALLAVALGIQNGVARRLAVPDLTTTVLTMTLTGIAAPARS